MVILMVILIVSSALVTLQTVYLLDDLRLKTIVNVTAVPTLFALY